MTTPQQLDLAPLNAVFFEDIIDGYFSLRMSLDQMLQRNGFTSALISLAHAPIMDVPKLAENAPVPLTIKGARAGIITRLSLHLSKSPSGLDVQGSGDWHWLGDTVPTTTLDPMTRLAEPAFVSGLGMQPLQSGTNPNCAHLEISPDQNLFAQDVLTHLGWDTAQIIGPFPDIAASITKGNVHRVTAWPTIAKTKRLPKGTYCVLANTERSKGFLPAWQPPKHRAFPDPPTN